MIELFTPRRVSVPDFRPLHLQSTCGTGLRYSQRAKGLSSAEEAAIIALAATKSLRSLAVDFGVSHETVRRVVRDVNAAGA
jgi:hypothetical protein